MVERIGLITVLLGGCIVTEPQVQILSETKVHEQAEDSGTEDAAVVPVEPRLCSDGECWWSARVEGCESAGVPLPAARPREAGSDPSLPAVYLGWSRLSLASPLHAQRDEQSWRGFGFDLDGVCTGSSGCAQPDATACRSRAPAPDGLMCRDNGLARLLAERATGIWNEDAINCALHRGTTTFVLRVSEYSGGPDDADVRADFYASLGLQTAPPWKCSGSDWSTKYPRWRATVGFDIDAASLNGTIDEPGRLPDAKLFDTAAYVKGGYLVARLPDGATLALQPDANFVLTIERGVLTGRLAREQTGVWSLRDGLIAGRVRRDALVSSMARAGLCPDDPRTGALVSSLDNALDVLADGSSDPARDCDALSFAIAFEADTLTPARAVGLGAVPDCYRSVR